MSDKICTMEITADKQFPMGVGLVMTADGNKIGTILSLDIETSLPMDKMVKPNLGDLTISGDITCHFEDNEAFASFVAGAQDLGHLVTMQTIFMGDQLLKDGKLNRCGRKWWSKKRKKLAALLRRWEAIERRHRHGLATF